MSDWFSCNEMSLLELPVEVRELIYVHLLDSFDESKPGEHGHFDIDITGAQAELPPAPRAPKPIPQSSANMTTQDIWKIAREYLQEEPAKSAAPSSKKGRVSPCSPRPVITTLRYNYPPQATLVNLRLASRQLNREIKDTLRLVRDGVLYCATAEKLRERNEQEKLIAQHGHENKDAIIDQWKNSVILSFEHAGPTMHIADSITDSHDSWLGKFSAAISWAPQTCQNFLNTLLFPDSLRANDQESMKVIVYLGGQQACVEKDIELYQSGPVRPRKIRTRYFNAWLPSEPDNRFDNLLAQQNDEDTMHTRRGFCWTRIDNRPVAVPSAHLRAAQRFLEAAASSSTIPCANFRQPPQETVEDGDLIYPSTPLTLSPNTAPFQTLDWLDQAERDELCSLATAKIRKSQVLLRVFELLSRFGIAMLPLDHANNVIKLSKPIKRFAYAIWEDDCDVLMHSRATFPSLRARTTWQNKLHAQTDKIHSQCQTAIQVALAWVTLDITGGAREAANVLRSISRARSRFGTALSRRTLPFDADEEDDEEEDEVAVENAKIAAAAEQRLMSWAVEVYDPSVRNVHVCREGSSTCDMCSQVAKENMTWEEKLAFRRESVWGTEQQAVYR